MRAICTRHLPPHAEPDQDHRSCQNMNKASKAQLKKKPAFQRLKKLLSKTDKRNLLWRHDIGKCVYSLVPSESRAYGEGRIERLAVALGKQENFGAILWGTRSFFEKYDRPDVRALCKRVFAKSELREKVKIATTPSTWFLKSRMTETQRWNVSMTATSQTNNGRLSAGCFPNGRRQEDLHLIAGGS